MPEKAFQLNEQSISVIQEIGKHMPGGFFIYRAEQPEELLYANEAVFSIFGCDGLEDFRKLTGYTFKGMIHPQDYDRVTASINRQIQESEEKMDYSEYRIIRKDGAVRWVDDYGHFTETEAYGGIYYVFISDITEKRERMESDQKQHRKQLDNMITAMASDYRSVYHVDLDADDAVCYRADPEDSTDQEGVHFPFHQRFEEYCAQYVDEEYQESFRRFIDPVQIRQSLATENIIAFRYLIRRGGKESYEMLRMAGVRHPADREDHIVHAVGLGFTDIDSEMRKNLEHQKALADALAAAKQANLAKTAFLSNMSHEIRTPMNAIIGLNSLALRNKSLPAETREYLEKIDGSARHLLGLINDILDMSRIESGRMILQKEEFSFRSMLEQINTLVMSQCAEKGLKYECQVLGGVSDYYIGDDMKLKQVLINILSNAIKFTAAPGHVTLTIERTAVFENQSTLKFMVKDTGIGMDKDFIPKIFNAFSQEDTTTTNRYGGSGLGMAITKNFVEMMNGEIHVDSEKGKGSTFTVTVTLKVSARSAHAEHDISLPDNLRAMVVDDDEIACEHTRLVLRTLGIESDTATDPRTALEMLRQAFSADRPYTLLLTDYKMPEMNGLELIRALRQFDQHKTAVIMLTGYNWDIIEEEARQDGVDGMMAKPLFSDVLQREIHSVLVKKDGLVTVSDTPVPLEKSQVDLILAGRRVLMAEDVEQNAEILTDLLELEEIEAEHARNGEMAVKMFSEKPQGYFDAILMDVRMPVMDGLSATRAIRAMARPDAKTIPIIAMTANVFDEDVERSLQAGMNAHLSKPIEPDRMYETMARLISEQEG